MSHVCLAVYTGQGGDGASKQSHRAAALSQRVFNISNTIPQYSALINSLTKVQLTQVCLTFQKVEYFDADFFLYHCLKKVSSKNCQ